MTTSKKKLFHFCSMQSELILNNLLNPPVLFFFLGLIAVFIKSDLEIPQPLPKLFSLYLLLSIGFKGGYELQHSGLDSNILLTLGFAVVMSVIVPFYTFFILKPKVGIHNAGAISATYGSVSAVTFITAITFLNDVQVDFGGHMVAALALMESPAIVVGVLLINLYSKNTSGTKRKGSLKDVLKEAFTNGSVVLIVGALIIGTVSSEKGAQALEPFTDDIFKGVLTIFLLDMGLLAANRIKGFKQAGGFLIAFSIIIPLINAAITMPLAVYLGIGLGDALLLTVLVASASYIAVPAAMRLAVPEANPGMYVPMSLAITFPFNIIIGIPLYYYILQWLAQ